MWYVTASVEQTVNKIAEELIRNRIRRAYVAAKNQYPTNYDLQLAMKRVKHKIKTQYNSIFFLRKETMEKKIAKLVDQVLSELKIV